MSAAFIPLILHKIKMFQNGLIHLERVGFTLIQSGFLPDLQPFPGRFPRQMPAL